MPFGVLTKLLNVFLFNFTGGTARLQPDALWLLGIFFGMELVLTGIWFLFRRELEWWPLIQKALTAGVFVWLIREWPTLTKVLAKGFIGAGLKLGGDVISETDFTDPDNIAAYGLSVTAVLMNHLSGPDYTGFNAAKNILEIFLSGGTAWVVVILYFLMGIAVFLTLLEFYLSTSVTVILLPWGMFSKTAFLAEKAIAHVFASGVRLLVLATILGSALPVMYTLQQGLNVQGGITVSLAAAGAMLCGALALLLLCLCANHYAQGLIHGAPALALSDASHLVQHMTTHLTRLGSSIQVLTEVLARTDPTHASRQQPMPSRRRP